MITRLLGWCAWLVLFVCPLANFALIATGSGVESKAGLVLWNEPMDAVIRAPDGNYRYAAGSLWEPRPGSSIEGDRINALGARGPETTEERNSKFRIAVVGDDQPAGLLLPEADSWPRQLEVRLREVGVDVEVINFAVNGYSAVQTANRLARVVLRHHPHLVLISCGLVNDLSFAASGYSDVELAAVAESGWERARQTWFGVTLISTLHATLGSKLEDEVIPRTCFRADPRSFRAACEYMFEAVRAGGATPVFVVPLRRFDAPQRIVDPQSWDRTIREVALQHDAHFIDLPVSFAKAVDMGLADLKGTGRAAFFLDPVHVSARGSAAIGAMVAIHLRMLKLVPPPTLAK